MQIIYILIRDSNLKTAKENLKGVKLTNKLDFLR